MILTQIAIYNTKDASFFCGDIAFENGVITKITPKEYSPDTEYDFLIPGLVDIHTHGRGSFDYNTASLEEMKAMKMLYAKQGVTTVVPTLASDTLDNLLASIERIKAAGYTAVHVEGRYLNPKRRGAHKNNLLAPLTKDEVYLLAKAANGMKLHISAAYELDTDGNFLKAVKDVGATAGLAHTDASFDEAESLVEKGLTSFTHLFNAMPPIHHRAGGAVLAGLLSRAYAEIICDGFHLAPETVCLVSRTKDPSRVILITDSMEGTGCADGKYSIAGNPVYLKDGKAYTEEGAIAGSTLELLDGVKNYAAFSGISFERALLGASANPAKMLSLDGVGKIEVGYRADLVRLSPNLTIKEVYLDGEKTE